MKQFIVLMASIMLGICLVNLIAGSDNSIKSSLEDAWVREIRLRTVAVEPAEGM